MSPMGEQRATYSSVSASGIYTHYANDAIPSRSATFDKAHSSTRLRLLYADNLRIAQASKYCVYEIKIDGATCPSGMVSGAIYGGNGNNEHLPHTIEGYCDNVPAGTHTLTVGLSGSSTACYTGWYSEAGTQTGDFYLEAQERPLNDPYFHVNNAVQSAFSPDTGTVTGRTLSFNKKRDESRLRISYHDNFRVIAASSWCSWEILVDGVSCPSARLVGQRYGTNSDNTHMPETIVGQCDGVAAGMHTLNVKLTNGGADCYTGWIPAGSAQFVLEAEERPVADPYLTSVTGRSYETTGSAGNTGLLAARKLTFVKLLEDSRIRITYYDNMRVRPSTAICTWSIFVDGQHCSTGPIKASIYQGGADNDHFFHTLVGSCNDISAGTHEITVSVASNSGSAQCYTGWDGAAQHFYLEAHELN